MEEEESPEVPEMDEKDMPEPNENGRPNTTGF